MMNQLTITVTQEGDRLVARCSELNCQTEGDRFSSLMANFEDVVDSAIYQQAVKDPSTISKFAKWLAVGVNTKELDQDFQEWKEEIDYYIRRDKLHVAFFKAYPKADKGSPFDHMAIPYHDYECELWDAARDKAYDALISDGPNAEAWVKYVQAITGLKYMNWVEDQKAETHKSWVDIGLPVWSVKKINAVYKKEGWKGFERHLGIEREEA